MCHQMKAKRQNWSLPWGFLFVCKLKPVTGSVNVQYVTNLIWSDNYE